MQRGTHPDDQGLMPPIVGGCASAAKNQIRMNGQRIDRIIVAHPWAEPSTHTPGSEERFAIPSELALKNS
jgi:hypothetical protein